MAGMPVIIRGEMYRTDVEVGGGPMPPGDGGGTPPDVGIWPSPGHPAHPIAPGGPPGSVWPGLPAHPIVIPPDFISPGVPAHPIVIPPPVGVWPGRPAHPIVIPPDLPGIWPGDEHPEHPIVIPPPTSIWPPRPAHPIELPPDGEPEPMPKWDVVAYWTPTGGWAMAIVPTDEATTPAPSSAAE